MDRLAFQNMTNKNRGCDQPGSWAQTQTPTLYSQPVGEATSKSKINTEVNNYFLERLDKNSQEYNRYVDALNGNIKEDQYRTTVNNTKWQSEHPINDTSQHVYHPTLLTDPERRTDNIGSDRYGMSTRDRQANGMAQTKNTVMTPLPKFNYITPQGYNQMGPIDMDMTSHLDQQFSSLTDPNMEQQISRLHKNVQNTGQPQQAIQPPLGPMGPMGPFGSTYPCYNPQVDHMNQQMQQWSQEVPPQRFVDPSQQMLDFHRPQSSNNRKFYPGEVVQNPMLFQMPFQTAQTLPPLPPLPHPPSQQSQPPPHTASVSKTKTKKHSSKSKKT